MKLLGIFISNNFYSRKQKFQEQDFYRKKNHELNELEIEAKELNEHLLEKAKAKRLEQEDEIKHLNELILNAKVLKKIQYRF